ncbi:hypothetical protein EV182_002354 [Spiromyces aspiralis]|uniref:Uncharacterized protein n=1 Tax=Spiromyces aspiralis TaxID=68401 RepID=A0ACC1HHV4_9FUNG|nr:hypothetical protein EV182_002354 [Spiromyces aspiralis]
MVSVAKNFDAPIKVLFPKVFTLNPSAKELTLLGLGDIVIPGIFIALAYRYDRHSYLQSIGYDRSKPLPAVLNGRHLRFPFPAPYFRATFAAYVAGLSTTFAVMHLFKAAQPALLYLSPACILAVLGTAFLRNELGAVMAFTEEHDDDKDDNKKEAKGKKAAGGGGMPTRPKHKAISSISAEATTQSSAQISQGEEADDEQEGVKPGHVLDEKINPVTDTVSRASSRADMAGPPSSPKAKKRTTKKKSKK